MTGQEAGSFLSQKNTFNALNIPSKNLVRLISYLEKKINEVVGDSVTNLLPNTFFTIFRKVDRHFVKYS